MLAGDYIEYMDLDECLRIDIHLTNCDDDGFCNYCGYQPLDDDEEVINVD